MLAGAPRRPSSPIIWPAARSAAVMWSVRVATWTAPLKATSQHSVTEPAAVARTVTVRAFAAVMKVRRPRPHGITLHAYLRPAIGPGSARKDRLPPTRASPPSDGGG